MTTLKVWRGNPYPLGATVTPDGVNFALFSENATGVDLCLFDDPDSPTETVRVRMTEHTDQVWHCLLPDLQPGQCYGFRVYGPYEPQHGHRFNDAKLLLDPYAKAVTGLINWSGEMFGYAQDEGKNADLTRDYRDDAWGIPKCVVVDDAFDWSGERRPDVPLAESVIYEVHVKGFSKLCPDIPEAIRGSYAALGSDFAVSYFQKLGITAIELMPVHHFVNDQFLQDKGLVNYWGYNSIAFFAPHATYASSGMHGSQVQEFKEMVKKLHAAGIEVILDVVYNHTGEGNQMGPTLCFRGVDNAAYYRLVPDDKRYYMDYTGTGNTLNMVHPRVLQLLMDSLRYWVTEMHVDGFRFDLAAALARELHDVSRLSAFFDCIHQDPIISQVKLIAEPWDVGEGGYQVGNFPVLWAEWNGKYRDCVRSYWKGDMNTIGEFAYRLTGSSDLYEWSGKRPTASINFITAHDGFSLYDQVSYNEKHNEANGENNQDGHNDNRSWNCGAEGETEDEAINTLRRRQLRNFLGTLLLSQGVPMITGGDEFARTQSGNNNAYCQDNEISWYSWQLADWQKELIEYTAKMIRLRREHPIFRRPKFFLGRRIRGAGVKDIMWFDVDGTEMTDENWNSGYALCLGMMLSGDTMDVRDKFGEPVRDDTFLLLFNAYHDTMPFTLAGEKDVSWQLMVDTGLESSFVEAEPVHASGEELSLQARSLAVLKLVKGSQAQARSASWKQIQKSKPTPPPTPGAPSKHQKVESTVAGKISPTAELNPETGLPQPTTPALKSATPPKQRPSK